jgi:hypothetical protein
MPPHCARISISVRPAPLFAGSLPPLYDNLVIGIPFIKRTHYLFAPPHFLRLVMDPLSNSSGIILPGTPNILNEVLSISQEWEGKIYSLDDKVRFPFYWG